VPPNDGGVSLGQVMAAVKSTWNNSPTPGEESLRARNITGEGLLQRP
jgi:hypothetical protein